MSQPLKIGAAEPLVGAPCLVCGRSTAAQMTLPRPHFDLPQPTPERQQRVAAYLADAPRSAVVCVSHLRDVSRLAFTLRESRLLVEAGKALWFSMFGHPLAGDRLLWRPAKRTPLAPPVRAAITAERLQKQRASERRRRKRRGRARILRGALLRLKFRVRGARMRGGT